MTLSFISYTMNDLKTAERIRKAVIGAKLPVWMAPYSISPGENYPDEIIRGLKNCDRVLLVLSRKSNASPSVQREIERAMTYGKTIIPIKIENFTLKGGLDFMIAGAQFIDATATDSEAWMEDVVDAAGQDLAVPSEMTRSPSRKFIRVDGAGLAMCAAAVIFAISLVLSMLPDVGLGHSDTLKSFLNTMPSPSLLAFGFVIIAAIYWGQKKFTAFRRKQIVIRYGDLVALGGVGIGLVLFSTLFLITPIIAGVLIGIAYMPYRNVFIKKWGVLAASVVCIFGTMVWYFEGKIYKNIFNEGIAVAIVPKCQEIECKRIDEDLYGKLISEIRGLLDVGSFNILPSVKTSIEFIDKAHAFKNDPQAANFVSLRTHRKTFDDIVEITLTPASCGSEFMQFSFEAAPVKRGEAPNWSHWERMLPKTIPVQGYLPLAGTNDSNPLTGKGRELRVTGLLIAGLILRDVILVKLDENGQNHLFDDKVKEQLLSAYLGKVKSFRDVIKDSDKDYFDEDTNDAISEATSNSASYDDVKVGFKKVVEKLKQDAEGGSISDKCKASPEKAFTELQARNPLN